MKSLNTYFKDEKEFSAFKKGFMQSSSFYREAKGKFATNPDLVNYFITKKPKEIYEDLLTEKEREKYPLISDRKRTPIGDQINNLKRYAKTLSNQTNATPEKKKLGNGLRDYLNKLTKDIDATYTLEDLASMVANLGGAIKIINEEYNKRKEQNKTK